MGKHKSETRRCPGCGKVSSFESRVEVCSHWCEQRRRTGSGPMIDESFEKDVANLFNKSIKSGTGGCLSLETLSEVLDRSPKAINLAVESLVNQGMNFEVLGQEYRLSPEVMVGTRHDAVKIYHSLEDYNGGWRRFGACGDFHMGSLHERLDVAHALYDIFEKEGVTEVFDTGNWIEGECRLNYGDIKVFGLDDQIEYAIKHRPQKKGIKTYFVAGDDHEGWWQKKLRINIGRHFEQMARNAGRDDLIYIGYQEGHVELKTKDGMAHMMVMHPGGGSAYAESYAPQKIAEAFQEGEKPDVCLIGHYHKANYGYHRGIHMVQTGTAQDQSSFMRKQKIKAAVGGWLIEMHQAPEGHVNCFKPSFYPFFDRGFYDPNRRHFYGNEQDRTVQAESPKTKVAGAYLKEKK